MSLLESCISVAIIVAIGFFAAPSIMKARDNYQLDQVTRVRAISRGRDCRIRVISNTSYAMECLDPVWVADQTVALPQGFQISANATPQFHKRGNVAPAATLTISDKHS